jgi:hypothetical protein
MAYVSQERKAQIAPLVKAVLKKYRVKGTLSVQNHSTLVLTVKSGKIDFIENFITTDAKKSYGKTMESDQVAYIRKNQSVDVNPYWFQEHFTGAAKNFLTEVFAAMKSAGWYDNSDAQVDYFDIKYYVDIRIGKWNQPYLLEA